MKHFILTIILSISCIAATAQYRYRVEDCWEMAKNNFPSIKYFNLIEKSLDYTLLNASEDIAPRNVDAINSTPTSDQEKNALSLASKRNVSAYNALHSTPVSLDSQNPLQISSPQSNLFVLNNRINNLFFSLILIDKKLKINELQQMQIIELTKIFTSTNDKKINNSVNIKGLNTLVEKSKVDYDNLRAIQKLYLDMLSQMIGRKVDEKTILLEPSNHQTQTKASVISATYYGMIDNNRYNPFTNNVNLNPKYQNYSTSNYKIFDVAKKVKTEESPQKDNYKLDNLKKSLFNINTNEQIDNQRTEIRNILSQIENDYQKVNLQKEVIIVSYNKIMRGIPDISNLTQSIIGYIKLQNDLAAHNVQLMMSSNKFRFLYN